MLDAAADDEGVVEAHVPGVHVAHVQQLLLGEVVVLQDREKVPWREIRLLVRKPRVEKQHPLVDDVAGRLFSAISGGAGCGRAGGRGGGGREFTGNQ